MRSKVWEETHLLPMRVKLQQEADGSIVMQLPGYQLSTVTVTAWNKDDALALIYERMYALMGKPSRIERMQEIEECESLRAYLEAVEAWFVECERVLDSPRAGVLFSLGAWWERRPRNRQKGTCDEVSRLRGALVTAKALLREVLDQCRETDKMLWDNQLYKRIRAELGDSPK